MRIIAIIAIASLLASFTDWLFMDVLIHSLYAKAPQVWRPRGGAGRIMVSQLVGTAASAAVVGLCLAGGAPPLVVAAGVWAAGPLPVILQNIQWLKLHPAVGASHAMGWLARFVIAAVLVMLVPGK